MVRAKFKCDSITKYAMAGGDVKLSPVTNGSKENEEFFKYTPTGEFVLRTVNESAFLQFTPGEEYYIDFTKVIKE